MATAVSLPPSTPLVGAHKRRTMNALLIKPELGSVKKTTYSLPGAEFTYGKALFREDEGTGEVMSWREHTPKASVRQQGRDFMALNKGAIMSGATTAKQQAEFRKTHDARMKSPGQHSVPVVDASSLIHGRPTRCAHDKSSVVARPFFLLIRGSRLPGRRRP